MYQSHRLLILLFTTFVIILSGCSSQKKLAKKAKVAYKYGEYAKAIELFDRLLEKEDVKSKEAEYSFMLGDCYRRINNSKKAERYFNKAIRKKYNKPIAKLYLADQLLKNEEPLEASVVYEEYKAKVPDDKRADFGMQSCSLAVAWMEKPTRYIVENIKDFNSRDNEFCPAYAKEDFSVIYFTSTKAEEGKKTKVSEVSGMNFTDIVETRLDRQGEWSKPAALEDTIINSPFDDGAISFTSDKNEMLYTFCQKEKGKQLGCQIYKAKKRGMEWGNPKQLSIVPDSISIGHPSLSADGLQLYFSARMSGGMGGADIWMCERKSETSEWGKPQNMGPSINTQGNEMYPYIRDDGNLYFSSDYWPGMGGLDIFRAIKDDAGFWQVNNMAYPINSYQDDFGIVFQGKKEIGHFSSSRQNGRGGDDIYSFELPELKFVVQGNVKDKGTVKAIPEAPIQLIGSDGSYVETKTKPDGTYSIQLKQYTDYIVLGAADGFLKKKHRISTNNLIEDSTFVIDFELITMSKPVEIPNIFYDFGKWTLNESSKDALVELAELLEDNPNITIELGAHTDMVGDSLSNMILSQKRAKSVIDYLNEKGYDPDRLVAKGYGENVPVVANEKLALQYRAVSVGDTLSNTFIESFEDKETQETLNQINRRTELRILSSNYIPKPEYFARFKSKRLKMEN